MPDVTSINLWSRLHMVGRFPKISAELANIRSNKGYNQETLLTATEKLAVKKTNVIQLRQAM